MNKKAFTLIELLIVVTIIGILAVALIPRIIGGSAETRDTRRKADMQTIATGLAYYLSENGHFEDIGGGGNAAGDGYCATELSADLTPYIGAIPTDPDDENVSTNAFGGDCADQGEYVVTFLDDSEGDLKKYAIAALVGTPEVGEEFVYRAASVNPDITDHADISDYELYTEATAKAYYVIY